MLRVSVSRNQVVWRGLDDLRKEGFKVQGLSKSNGCQGSVWELSILSPITSSVLRRPLG